MTIDEAIQYMEAFLSNNAMFPPMKTAAQMAIDALSAQRKSDINLPLTLDELRQMDGQPVWCKDGAGNACWCLLSVLDDKSAVEGAIDAKSGFWAGEFYGMSGDKINELHSTGWIAYRRPPDDD